MRDDHGTPGQETPLVTVGISFKDAASDLAQAIRSVFAQTCTRWELVLVDDGSSDSSLAIASAVEDSRVTVHSDGKNLGLAARLNQIVGLARAPYVARMDADDLMSPDRLQRQIDYLDENPWADLVGTGLFSVRDDGRLVARRGYDSDKVRARDIYNRRGITHASIVGRRSWFTRNPYDAELRSAEDYDLWLAALNRKDFRAASISAPLYVYREQGSLTPTKLLSAYSVERRIYRVRVSGWRRWWLMGSSYAKSGIVNATARLDMERWLWGMRPGIEPTADDLEEYRALVGAVTSARVPGLDRE